ncbi:phage holin [Escherichia coli]|uniref:phage holin n=1 Tax=Escherichia coli TaxID=562 RepID=UPI00339C915A
MDTHHITTGASYGAAMGSFVTGLLNYFTPEQWSAVGVLGGLLVAIITMLINVHFRRINAREWRNYLRNQGSDSMVKQPED